MENEEARAKLHPDHEALEVGQAEMDASKYLVWADWFSSVTESWGNGCHPTNSMTAPDEMSRTGATTMPMWEKASALLRLRNPSTPGHTVAENNAQLPSSFNLGDPSLEADLNNDLHNFNENRMQLMGLTGIDMLDFGFGQNTTSI